MTVKLLACSPAPPLPASNGRRAAVPADARPENPRPTLGPKRGHIRSPDPILFAYAMPTLPAPNLASLHISARSLNVSMQSAHVSHRQSDRRSHALLLTAHCSLLTAYCLCCSSNRCGCLVQTLADAGQSTHPPAFKRPHHCPSPRVLHSYSPWPSPPSPISLRRLASHGKRERERER